MNTSERGIALIKEFEAFKAHLYNDQAGHCTIGYGHLVHYGPIDGRASETPFANGISEAQACELMQPKVRDAEVSVKHAVTTILNQNQFDACVSLAYNIGGGAFMASTLAKKIDAGDIGTIKVATDGRVIATGACAEFLRWNHAGGAVSHGLTERRIKEAQLFATEC